MSSISCAVPTSQLGQCRSAGVENDFDIAMEALDHVPVFLSIDFKKQSGRGGWRKQQLAPQSRLYDKEVLQQVARQLECSAPVPWAFDTHSHCHILES